MKIYTYLLIAIILPTIAFTQDSLYYPIDIVYHPTMENYFVSNWADGDGYILKLDKEGNILERYYDDLHYAGGLCIAQDSLYVLDNLDLNVGGSSLPSYIIGIDLNTGNEISKVEISTGGTYLNFVEKALNGSLYISDSQKNTIYKYNLKNRTVANFLTDLNNPFGLCYDYYKEILYFTENGTGISYLKSVPPWGGSVQTTFYTDAYIKGIVMHPNADFYYTTWDAYSTQWGDEEVRKVNNNFTWDFLSSNDHNRPFGLCMGYDDFVVVCNWGDHTLSFLNDQVFSVDELPSKTDAYTIYPNPNNGIFQIKFSAGISSDIELTILNITGQQVYSEKINNSNLLTERKLNLQHLQAGTYVVILKDDHSISQKKLIIR